MHLVQRTPRVTMFKRTENMSVDDDFDVPAKRAKFDIPKTNSQHGKIPGKEISRNKNVRYDDPWGDDDFVEKDIEEIDFVASQALLQEGNILDSKFGNSSQLIKSAPPEKPAATTSVINCNETSRSKLPAFVENSNLWLKKTVQGTSQGTSHDITDFNYSQFKNKLIDRKDHNSTFQRGNNFTIPDDRELERLKNENKKLLDDFITKDGETAFLRQQLQQIHLRVEKEKSQKMHLIEDQANRHRSEINKICKEKEQLKTQIQLQNLEIENLAGRCKQLESGNIKLKEPQSLHANTSFNKNKCNTSTRWPTNINKNLAEVREVCIQANINNKNDYQLRTHNTYFSLSRISELMFGASVPEKPIINIKVIEKTGRRNLPILQEEETFRIFENPDLVKPVVTIVDGKKLTTEFVLLELAAIERKINTEIESESCTPIINKVSACAKVLVSRLYENRMKRRLKPLHIPNIICLSEIDHNKKDTKVCVKSECEADAWYDGEHGIEARRLLGALSHISCESSYLSNYLTGKSPLHTRNDECYIRYLPQMTRYNAWPKKNHKFEMLEMIKECVTLIQRVRRSHQFTGLLCAIIKVLCNVQEKVGYCERGLEYVCLIFKELVFSKPLSLCYSQLTHFIMVFSRCGAFVPKLCRGSQPTTIKNWKGALHFTPDACVLQILIIQMEHFRPDFLTTLNMTHALISSVRYFLQTNNNLLRTDNSESCNCYKKLLQFTIKMLERCCETRLIDDIECQDLFHTFNKCYTLKKVDYKDYACRMKSTEQHPVETYPEKLDRNFWSGIREIQHQVLREGIRFLCRLTISDPNFVIQSPDIENLFHLFMKNVTFVNDLILHENEREAFERLKSTCIVDKGVQNETETHQKNARATKWKLTNHRKKVTPATRNLTETTDNFNRIHMSTKALFNSKIM